MDTVNTAQENTASGEITTSTNTPEINNASSNGAAPARKRRKRIAPPLMKEYHALKNKELLEQITPEETVRLHEVKVQLYAPDQADPSNLIWQKKFDEMKAELQRIRREIEALPDAE